MARTSRTSRPCWAAWNACAVPAKLVLMVDGSTWAAAAWTRSTAVPIEVPGSRLNDNVTDGNWPEWLTVSGPVDWVTRARLPRGTDTPCRPLMWSMLMAERSRWYWGSSSITTQYWSFGV